MPPEDASIQGLAFDEHGRLITEIYQVPFLAKFESKANHHPRRADPGFRLSRDQLNGWSDSGQLLEIRPVDAVAETRPTLIPAATMEEVGVQATQASGYHDEFGPRNMGGVQFAHTLARRERKATGGFKQSFHQAGFSVHPRDFIDQHRVFAVEKSVEKVLKIGG